MRLAGSGADVLFPAIINGLVAKRELAVYLRSGGVMYPILGGIRQREIWNAEKLCCAIARCGLSGLVP